MFTVYVVTYRKDGTLSSVGKLEGKEEIIVNNTSPADEEDGEIVITKEQHDEMLLELDAFIVSEGKPRKRTQTERRARYEELYKRCLLGELAHRKGNPASILVKWKDEFLPEACRGTV